MIAERRWLQKGGKYLYDVINNAFQPVILEAFVPFNPEKHGNLRLSARIKNKTRFKGLFISKKSNVLEVEQIFRAQFHRFEKGATGFLAAAAVFCVCGGVRELAG